MVPSITAQAPLPTTPPVQGSKSVASEAPAAPAAAAPEPKPPVDPLASRYADLARREKAFRKQVTDFKSREGSIDQTVAQKQAEYEKTYNQRLSQDFWGTAIAAGLTPDQIIENLTNKPTQEGTALTQLQLKLKAVEEQQARLLNQNKDAETQATEQARGLIRNDITRLIAAVPDQFEAITATDSQEAVLGLIEETLNPSDGSQGYMMSVEDAAKEVEDYMMEKLLGFQKLKKIQSKLSPPVDPAQQPAKPLGKPPTQTISNRSVPSSAPQKFTPAQRVERAKRIAQGLPVD